ncbi:hypothetical protein [Streptomyces sp. NPDC005438]|uniref:hypothetical protein n=1 Tax=Streptomyces sp. NPDC005438 TaxID=3156880 RepID=UPI0033A2B967
MAAGGSFRLLRAALFAAACVALSAGAHLFAGGDLGVWPLLWGTLLVLAVAVPLAGRERGGRGICAALGASQLGLHLLFSLCSGGAHTGTHPVDEGERLRQLAATLLCDEHRAGPLTEARARQVVADAGLSPDVAGHAGHLQGTGGSPVDGVLHGALEQLADWPMLLAHLLAALAVGWLVRRGEVALWRLVRAAGTGLGAVTSWWVAVVWARGPLTRPRPMWVVAAPERAEAKRQVPLLRHVVSRRGPPGGDRSPFDLAA